MDSRHEVVNQVGEQLRADEVNNIGLADLKREEKTLLQGTFRSHPRTSVITRRSWCPWRRRMAMIKTGKPS